MQHRLNQNRNEQGVALFFSLGIIVFFAMLGAAYIGYMNNAYDGSRNDINAFRVHGVAEAGIQGAIAEIQAALLAEEKPESTYTFTTAVYRHEQDGPASYPQEVTVTVVDEMARININHVPQSALEAFGFKAEEAAALVKSRPKNSRKGQYLGTVGDIVARDIISKRRGHDFDDAALFDEMTVYTAADSASPRGYINVNGASLKVLAAVFNVDEAEAKIIADKRPFSSWADVLEKVAREPNTFNIGPARIGSRSMPEALALSSRCFRLTAQATVEFTGSRRKIDTAVEAVVLIDEDGQAHIRFWNARPDNSTS